MTSDDKTVKTVTVVADEWYPVYDVQPVTKMTPDWMRVRIDVSRKDLRRWTAAKAAFNKAQREIGAAVKAQREIKQGTVGQ